MKIILSRKGFDSVSGGRPSPIMPDGTLISLPIPDETSDETANCSYGDIDRYGYSLGKIVDDLCGCFVSDYPAHLDPDLVKSDRKRTKHWKPALGQVMAAQTHLANHQVGVGDLFLFFGLFRDVEDVNGTFRYRRDSKPAHWIWGWMRIGEMLTIDLCTQKQLSRFAEHPHVAIRKGHYLPDIISNDTLYVASDRLGIHGVPDLPGAGVFTTKEEAIRLTAPGEKSPSKWQLPGWFYPKSGVPALSYHESKTRWTKKNDMALLSSVGRGQEFILDSSKYPESKQWLKEVFALI